MRRCFPGVSAAFLTFWLALAVPDFVAAAVDVLAEVEGEEIRAQDLEEALAVPLAKLEEQIYDLKRKKLEEMIGEKLLAREASRRAISVQQLLDAEVTSKVGVVTGQEVDTFYQQNRGRLQGDEKSLKERIRSYLQSQRIDAQREAFVSQLRSQRRVVVRLAPPKPIRVAVEGRDGAAVKGPAEAKLVIVEFSDFQCPFCRRVLPDLYKLLEAYSKDVKLVFRHFPLDAIHPQARLAAEAAECAGTKGRFWEYHDHLFAQSDLSLPRLKELAKGLNLDVAAFEQCLNDEAVKARVAQDVEAGTRAGVTGTPTFFINGRPLVGAQPFDSFKSVIEQELASLRK
jgi:protein-disulfide isomerase